ncbi:enoyl-CoA hydratase/isomerase family protein [Rhodococcus koreensis]|uniref:Enoyl-CoA hydratase/carnithine racemase n=1 Tax=Rhodococcus koreensis TaxID=99653 RepID=A0A1H4MFB5_9NOCA|nr:enoyl-CoA hydratase/isomerase family protein [Rhodococcus koreensis]SEB81800.1 Enoyl-CoA hydratase/carnithine racemase [Rhodococcus koreensis]
MVEDTVSYESVDNIAIITINRPGKKNAVNSVAAVGLEDAWLRFDRSEDRVAVLTGSEGNFTVGVDVTDPPTTSAWAPHLGPSTNKPIIAAIDGWCVGAGMILLQQADLSVATTNAKFRYPEARLGLSRGLAAGLATKIPHKLAMEILLLGHVLGPDTLFRAGLVNKVVGPGEVLDVALGWAGEIAASDADAVRFIKEGVLATVPRGAGEHGEHARWLAAQLPGNQRLMGGGLSLAELKGL